jgi:uncharacterized protein (DUF427 family)
VYKTTHNVTKSYNGVVLSQREERRALYVARVSRGHEIKIEPSSQTVKVSYNGVVLAETSQPVLLHESRLPTRYYIPASDVRMDLLTPTTKHTECPFKGTASYWSARVRDETVSDLVWSYPEPIPQAEQIAGLLCFYNERVDLEVDGRPQLQESS